MRRCVNSAIAYGVDIDIAVFFDDDAECFDAFAEPPNCGKYLVTPQNYYVTVMNTALEWLIEEGVDHFVICNNDMEFIEPGWDRIAMNKLYEHWPDGMGVLEIGNHADLSYNVFLSRVKFWAERFDGKLFDPDFIQYFADADRLVSLEKKGWIARLNPGLVNTHSCWDEVKHSGRKHWMVDQTTFGRKVLERAR